MSTRALIDRVVPRVGSGWGITGNRSLLKLAEKGLDALYQSITERRVWIGTDNKGFPPYLKTTAGTYTYEIVAANLSASALTINIGGTAYPVTADQVLKVFIDTTNNDYEYNKRWIGEPFLYAPINPYTQQTDRIWAARIPVDTTPAYESSGPTVTFKDDPGTDEDKYFVEFTWRAPRLTSVTIPMPIPVDFEEAIEDFIVGAAQKDESGSQSELTKYFYSFWVPKFRAFMNRGGRAKSTQTMTRPC